MGSPVERGRADTGDGASPAGGNEAPAAEFLFQPASSEEMDRLYFHNVAVEKAKATVPDDRTMIFDDLRARIRGGFAEVNDRVRNAIMKKNISGMLGNSLQGNGAGAQRTEEATGDRVRGNGKRARRSVKSSKKKTLGTVDGRSKTKESRVPTTKKKGISAVMDLYGQASAL
jgi:hypothetical protein